MILLYLQTETQITRSKFSLNQQYQKILSGIYSIYQLKKKSTLTSRILMLCVMSLQGSLCTISHFFFTKTLQSIGGSYHMVQSFAPACTPSKR